MQVFFLTYGCIMGNAWIKHFSPNMRAPGWGISGWLSRKMMESSNSESSVDVVQALLSGLKVWKLTVTSHS